MNITRNELLDALLEAGAPVTDDPGAQTVTEMAVSLGMSVGMVRRRMRALRAQGRVTTVWVRRAAADRLARVPAYLIARAPKKKRQ